MRALQVVGAVVASGVGLGVACSSADFSRSAEPQEAGPPPDGGAPVDRVSIDFDADPAPPPGLPDGWDLDRTYWNQCGFYVPVTKDRLPPALTWEPCPSNAEPSGVDCKLMTVGWDNTSSTSKKGYADTAWTTPAGETILGVTRAVSDTFAIRQIVEVDGPVRNALLETRTKWCSLAFTSIFRNRYAWRLFEAGDSDGGGLLASEFDTLRPRLALHLAPLRDHSPYAAPFAIVDLSEGTFGQFSWSDGAALPTLWSAAQDDGLQQGVPVFAGDAMFWPASNSLYHKVKVYTPAGGVRDFLSVGLVFDHGFADLGTDGADLVWIEAQGRTSSSSSAPFQTYTVMTSPFTTDASQLKPRRLRTEEGPSFDVHNFVVGCGFAARTNGYHVRVVRLSDGVSWILPSVNGAPVDWQTPLAVTCTELIVGVWSGDGRTARVRLDSLGPGIPPD